MSRVCLYYRKPAEQDRWLPGDRLVRPLVRRLVRRGPREGGIDKVFRNLCLGLDRLGVTYSVNLPFAKLDADDRVGVLGVGRHALAGYDHPNPIVAGIGLMTHPSEWPTLCVDYPVVFYLQHSEWASDLYRPFFGHRCRVWPVGIDTATWRPADGAGKSIDFLVYDKIMWNREQEGARLLEAIRHGLSRRNLTWIDLRYGAYREDEYKDALAKCRAMIFLCEHESQGIAYLECLATATPILAWDQGRYLDPHRFQWGQPDVPATSVPYFDPRCGERFADIAQFPAKLHVFLDRLKAEDFRPRDYILENLTLEKCAQDFVAILEEARATCA